MSNKKKNLEDGVQGLGIGIVNTNSKEFKALQNKIIEESKKLSKKQILENKLFSLRFQMERYLEEEKEEIIEVGTFLKKYVKALGIKNKTFADYLGYKESNLSALFNGSRKINVDLALKLGKIFGVDPTIWIHIQSKNEIKKMSKEKSSEYHKYSIDDLLKKAS